METLRNIQSELKAPKNQYNSFGKYKYRSAEDILEAVKPLCVKHNATLRLSDTLVNSGERYYIKATATLITKDNEISVDAYAREVEDKKGLDGSQITGTASSYARKYALNGLFLIDDTKDADTDAYKMQQDRPQREELPKQSKDELIDKIVALCDAKHLRVSDVCKTAKVTELAELTVERLESCIEWINSK